jgi:putative acetyltransferase
MAGHPIREFKANDMPALLDLWQESWQITLPQIDFSERREWFERYLAGLAITARLRVAFDSEAKPAGFVTIDPTTGYLDQIVVRRDLWGKGIAVALLDEAKALSPDMVELRVNQANLRAIALYERQGFSRIKADISETSGLPLWVYVWRAI